MRYSPGRKSWEGGEWYLVTAGTGHACGSRWLRGRLGLLQLRTEVCNCQRAGLHFALCDPARGNAASCIGIRGRDEPRPQSAYSRSRSRREVRGVGQRAGDVSDGRAMLLLSPEEREQAPGRVWPVPEGEGCRGCSRGYFM